MIIQMQSTSHIVQLNGVPARVWEGITDSGINVHCFVTRIAVQEGQDAEAMKQFDEEMQLHKPPTEKTLSFSLRMII